MLRLEQLAQLTQVYQVLTETSFTAALIVLRSARIAVPASNSAEIQQLSIQIQKSQGEINDLTRQITALNARKQQLEKLGPANPRVRRMLQALQVQLNNLTAQRTAKTTEQRQKRAQLASLRKQKLFRVALQVLDWAVAPNPFVFAKDLHRYIFGNVLPPESGKIGFVLRQVVWKERSHTYYQQSLEPHRFHFLPDSFKVARRPETPHHPMLAVRFPNPDAAADVMPVTLEYVAGPYFDEQRLEAAATEMKRKLPELGRPSDRVRTAALRRHPPVSHAASRRGGPAERGAKGSQDRSAHRDPGCHHIADERFPGAFRRVIWRFGSGLPGRGRG